MFERFLLDVAMGQSEEAFEAIEPTDRAQLLAAREALGVPDDAKPKPEEMLIVAGIDSAYDIKKIEVDPKLTEAPKPGTRVKLRLRYEGERVGEAFMIWSGERWFVDLPLNPKG